jgi:hypothetical protein
MSAVHSHSCLSVRAAISLRVRTGASKLLRKKKNEGSKSHHGTLDLPPFAGFTEHLSQSVWSLF